MPGAEIDDAYSIGMTFCEQDGRDFKLLILEDQQGGIANPSRTILQVELNA